MSRTKNHTWAGPRKVLCVDKSSRAGHVASKLEAEGWKVVHAKSISEAAFQLQRRNYDVGLLYLEYVPFAEELLALDHSVHWIALVSEDALRDGDVQRLLSSHFYDYHRLPVDIPRLTTTLGRASGIAQLRRLQGDDEDHVKVNELIGKSAPMKELERFVSRVAEKNMPVLISGESGTGKELVARAIHDQSKRCDGPIVAINCGALPSSLIQSELFGHERGAFTGADRQRLGRFEAASGGTLFLDEIGDLSFDVQANLLRVLEQSVIERVGDNQSRPVDVRIVAATNIDLQEAVREKKFREDLFYRINVFQIKVPPLADRGDDIELLAQHFLSRFCDRKLKTFSKRSIAVMRAYTWPGNVRELINRVQRAYIASKSNIIMPDDLGLETVENEDVFSGPTLEEARSKIERSVIRNALWRNTNNLSRVARELAVSRVTLYRLLKKHDLESTNRER